MKTIIPGTVVKTFTTKKNKLAVLRYPTIDDVDEMTRYINELSKEDTYILFSGEEISNDQEREFLKTAIAGIEMGERVMILAFIDDELVGISEIGRNLANKKRSLHTGILGLSLSAHARGEGIGYELADVTINEATKNIDNLQIIILEVFENNPVAIHVYEKLGFKSAGMIPHALYFHGTYVGAIHMYKEIHQI